MKKIPKKYIKQLEALTDKELRKYIKEIMKENKALYKTRDRYLKSLYKEISLNYELRSVILGIISVRNETKRK